MEEAQCLMKSTRIGATRFILTGRAARKEVYFASESPENQRLLLAAMERGGAQGNIAIDAGCIAHVEISISKSQNCWHALGFDAQGTRFRSETCGTGLPGGSVNDAHRFPNSRDSFSWFFLAQHKNIGSVVPEMLPLHTCRQEA